MNSWSSGYRVKPHSDSGWRYRAVREPKSANRTLNQASLDAAGIILHGAAETACRAKVIRVSDNIFSFILYLSSYAALWRPVRQIAV